MKIAFISAGDPDDKAYSSGVYHYTSRALEEQCGEVHHLGPARPLSYRLGKAQRHASRILLRRNYDFLHSRRLAGAYARIFGRALAQGDYDIVFAQEAATEIALLETDIPIVYGSDTTFALARDYYPFYTNLMRSSAAQADALEASAIGKAAALVYPTPWAARSAIEDYGAAESRVHVFPYGANLDNVPARDEIEDRVPSGACRLLLVGVDWERKGCDVALDALRELGEMGVDASLTVCGCSPPHGVSHPRLTVIPYLDKNDREQGARLAGLFLAADFFLLPSRAENAAFVLCEAAAYGLPALGASTGGIPGIIQDGINGFLLPPDADGRAYAAKIREVLADQALYRELRRSSRQRFEDELNWETWGRRVREVLEGCLK